MQSLLNEKKIKKVSELDFSKTKQIKARDLLTSDRLDIVSKYLYIKYKDTFHKELYLKTIHSMN